MAKILIPIFLISILSISTIACSPCENEVLEEIPSPNGTLRAIVFQRECGATVGSNRQVSLLPQAQRLSNAGGNVLILDSDHGRGSLDTEVTWTDNDHLLIRYDPRARVFDSNASVHGVEVTYDEHGSHGS